MMSYSGGNLTLGMMLLMLCVITGFDIVGASFFQKTRAVDKIGDGKDLFVRCRSSENDLGTHIYDQTR
jgi:hypothetical protein